MIVSCFHCGRDVQIDREHLGQKIRCPHCQNVFPVPAAGPSEDEYLDDSGSRGRLLLPTLVSCLFHGGLLLLCSLVTWSYQAGGGLGEEVLIGELPSVELEETGEEELQPGALDPVVEETSDLVETLEEVAPPSPADDQQATDVPAFPVAPAGSLGELAEVQMVAGGGSGAGTFRSFGHRGQAKWLCIVADRSGSMEGEKLQYVKSEILETLTRLKSNQRFQLVFFSGRPLPYPKSGWLHPDRERASIRDWLDKVDAGGETEPTPAFEVAFRLRPRPDAIVFLTDGLFDEQVVAEVARLNNRGEKRTKIYTVSFVDKSAEALLREIARNSGGKYRHVSGY